MTWEDDRIADKVLFVHCHDLSENHEEPFFLEESGFVRREEETSDVVRWAYTYERSRR